VLEKLRLELGECNKDFELLGDENLRLKNELEELRGTGLNAEEESSSLRRELATAKQQLALAKKNLADEKTKNEQLMVAAQVEILTIEGFVRKDPSRQATPLHVAELPSQPMEFALKELSEDESDEVDTPDEPLEVYDEKTVTEFYQNQLARHEEARRAKIDKEMTEISLLKPEDLKYPEEPSPQTEADEKEALATSHAEPEGEILDKESVVTTETIHELAKMHYYSTLRLSSLYQVGENAPHY
jgi:hypothetical protein